MIVDGLAAVAEATDGAEAEELMKSSTSFLTEKEDDENID